MRYSAPRVALAVITVLLLTVLGCRSQSGEESGLLVFAAISLTDSMTELGKAFGERHDVHVSFSYGGSQTLAQQIASGAPADVFIAAGEFPVDFLVERDLVEPDAILRLLSNRLVAATRDDGVILDSIEQLASGAVERVAIANPDLAPAGRYAKEALVSLGLWDGLQGKLMIGADVRATLTYVRTGNADVALVYQTDAMNADNVNALDIVPVDRYPGIVYPAAVIERSEAKAQAGQFLDFLQSEASVALFQKHGFDPLRP